MYLALPILIALLVVAYFLGLNVGKETGEETGKETKERTWKRLVRQLLFSEPNLKVRQRLQNFVEEEMIRRSYKESAPHYFCEFPGCCTPITGNITNPFCDEHKDTVAKSFWRRESENKSSTIYEQAVDKFLELCNYEKIWLEYLRMGTFEREKFLRKSGINPKLFFKQTYLFAPPFFDFSWMEIPYDQGDEDSE